MPAAVPAAIVPRLGELATVRRLARTTRAGLHDQLKEIATDEGMTVADLLARRGELVDERTYAQQRLIEKIREHEGFSPPDESSLLRIHADDVLARDDAPTDLEEAAHRFASFFDVIDLIDAVPYLDDRIDRIDRLEAALFHAHALGAHDESAAGDFQRLQSHLSKLEQAATAIYRNDMARVREHEGENSVAGALADPVRQSLEDSFRNGLADALKAVAAIRALDDVATPPLIGDELNALGDRDADRRRDLHKLPTTRDSDSDSPTQIRKDLETQREQRRRSAEGLAAQLGTAPAILTPARVRRIAEVLERQGAQDARARAAAKCRTLDIEIESSEELLAVTTRTQGIDRLRAALFQAQAHLPVLEVRLVAAQDAHRQLLDRYRFGLGAGLVDTGQVREQLRSAEQWRGGSYGYEHDAYLKVRAALHELLDLAGQRELRQWQLQRLQDLGYRLDALAAERTRVLDERAAVEERIAAQTELDFGWLSDDTGRGAQLRRFQAGQRAALAAMIGPDSLAEHELTAATLTAEQISMVTLSRADLFADAVFHDRVAELARLEQLIADVAESELLTAQLERIDAGLAKGLATDVDAVFAATVAPDRTEAGAEPTTGTVEHLWQPAQRNCFVQSGLGVYEAAGGAAPAKLRGHVTGPAGVLAGESFELLGADPREGGYRNLDEVAEHVEQTGDAVLVVLGFQGFTDASRPGSHAVHAFWDGEFEIRADGTRVPVPGAGDVVVIDNGERFAFTEWAAEQTGIRSVSGWEIMQGGTPRRPLVDGKSRAVAGLDYDNVGIAGRRTSLANNADRDAGSGDVVGVGARYGPGTALLGETPESAAAQGFDTYLLRMVGLAAEAQPQGKTGVPDERKTAAASEEDGRAGKGAGAARQESPRSENQTLLLVEAVAARESQLLEQCRIPLTRIAKPMDMEVFDRYFLRGQPVDQVASALRRSETTVGRVRDRLARLVIELLPADLPDRYTAGGVLRRTTQDHVAREAGVTRPIVARILGDKETPVDRGARDRVLAAARKLGYQPVRSGVILESTGVRTGSPATPVPVVGESQQAVVAATRRRSAALPVVHAASRTRLQQIIPKLPETDREVATRLFVENWPVRELAELLGRSPGSVAEHRRRIAVRLAALLTGGELRFGTEAVAVIREIVTECPEALEALTSQLSAPMRDRYTRYFVDRHDARATAASEEGGNEAAVDQWARTLAEEWTGRLPADLVRNPARVGPKWRALPWERLREVARARIADSAVTESLVSMLTAEAVGRAQHGVGALADDADSEHWISVLARDVVRDAQRFAEHSRFRQALQQAAAAADREVLARANDLEFRRAFAELPGHWQESVTARYMGEVAAQPGGRTTDEPGRTSTDVTTGAVLRRLVVALGGAEAVAPRLVAEAATRDRALLADHASRLLSEAEYDLFEQRILAPGTRAPDRGQDTAVQRMSVRIARELAPRLLSDYLRVGVFDEAVPVAPHGPAPREAGLRNEICARRMVRVLRALGLAPDLDLDENNPAWDAVDNWRIVEDKVAADLVDITSLPITDHPRHRDDPEDPLTAQVAATLRASGRDGDSAVIVADGHGWLLTMVAGDLYIHDTAIDTPMPGTAPRIRLYHSEYWTPENNHTHLVDDKGQIAEGKAFVAYLTEIDGSLVALNARDPGHENAAHPPERIEGLRRLWTSRWPGRAEDLRDLTILADELAKNRWLVGKLNAALEANERWADEFRAHIDSLPEAGRGEDLVRVERWIAELTEVEGRIRRLVAGSARHVVDGEVVGWDDGLRLSAVLGKEAEERIRCLRAWRDYSLASFTPRKVDWLEGYCNLGQHPNRALARATEWMLDANLGDIAAPFGTITKARAARTDLPPVLELWHPLDRYPQPDPQRALHPVKDTVYVWSWFYNRVFWTSGPTVQLRTASLPDGVVVSGRWIHKEQYVLVVDEKASRDQIRTELDKHMRWLIGEGYVPRLPPPGNTVRSNLITAGAENAGYLVGTGASAALDLGFMPWPVIGLVAGSAVRRGGGMIMDYWTANRKTQRAMLAELYEAATAGGMAPPGSKIIGDQYRTARMLGSVAEALGGRPLKYSPPEEMVRLSEQQQAELGQRAERLMRMFRQGVEEGTWTLLVPKSMARNDWVNFHMQPLRGTSMPEADGRFCFPLVGNEFLAKVTAYYKLAVGDEVPKSHVKFRNTGRLDEFDLTIVLSPNLYYATDEQLALTFFDLLARSMSTVGSAYADMTGWKTRAKQPAIVNGVLYAPITLGLAGLLGVESLALPMILGRAGGEFGAIPAALRVESAQAHHQKNAFYDMQERLDYLTSTGLGAALARKSLELNRVQRAQQQQAVEILGVPSDAESADMLAPGVHVLTTVGRAVQEWADQHDEIDDVRVEILSETGMTEICGVELKQVAGGADDVRLVTLRTTLRDGRRLVLYAAVYVNPDKDYVMPLVSFAGAGYHRGLSSTRGMRWEQHRERLIDILLPAQWRGRLPGDELAILLRTLDDLLARERMMYGVPVGQLIKRGLLRALGQDIAPGLLAFFGGDPAVALRELTNGGITVSNDGLDVILNAEEEQRVLNNRVMAFPPGPTARTFADDWERSLRQTHDSIRGAATRLQQYAEARPDEPRLRELADKWAARAATVARRPWEQVEDALAVLEQAVGDDEYAIEMVRLGTAGVVQVNTARRGKQPPRREILEVLPGIPGEGTFMRPNPDQYADVGTCIVYDPTDPHTLRQLFTSWFAEWHGSPLPEISVRARGPGVGVAEGGALANRGPASRTDGGSGVGDLTYLAAGGINGLGQAWVDRQFADKETQADRLFQALMHRDIVTPTKSLEQIVDWFRRAKETQFRELVADVVAGAELAGVVSEDMRAVVDGFRRAPGEDPDRRGEQRWPRGIQNPGTVDPSLQPRPELFPGRDSWQAQVFGFAEHGVEALARQLGISAEEVSTMLGEAMARTKLLTDQEVDHTEPKQEDPAVPLSEEQRLAPHVGESVVDWSTTTIWLAPQRTDRMAAAWLRQVLRLRRGSPVEEMAWTGDSASAAAVRREQEITEQLRPWLGRVLDLFGDEGAQSVRAGFQEPSGPDRAEQILERFRELEKYAARFELDMTAGRPPVELDLRTSEIPPRQEDRIGTVSAAARQDEGHHGPALRDGAHRNEICARRLVRVLQALGNASELDLDENNPAWHATDNWRILEDKIVADLVDLNSLPVTDHPPHPDDPEDPLAQVAATLRASGKDGDTAVVVVDDGDTAHGYLLTVIAGTLYVHDTAIDTATPGSIPRIRLYHRDHWQPTYSREQLTGGKVFVAYFDDKGGELGARDARDPAHENAAHPGRTITRPGPTEPEFPGVSAEQATRARQLYAEYSKPVLAQVVPRSRGDRELVRTVLRETFLRLAGEAGEQDGRAVDLPGRAVELALEALEYEQFQRGFDEFRQRMWSAAKTDRIRTALAAATPAQMWQAVTELPVAWRQATLLRYLTGMDLPAVVEVMEHDGSLVEAMLRDGMLQMAARLAEQVDDAAGSPVPQQQPKVRQPTLADIARAAGVGISTVHFAVNEREIPNISKETSERVRRLAVEMGYPVGKKVDRAPGVRRANTLVDQSETTGVNLSALSRARSGLPISEQTRQRLATAPGDGVADKPRVTLAEVAQRAGTSVTTASRVLRNEPQPAGVTQRVMAAIAELGYAASVYTRRAPEPAPSARWSPPRRGGARNSSPGFSGADAFEEPRDPREDLGLPARRRRVSGPRYGPEVFFARDPRIPRGIGARADEQAPVADGGSSAAAASARDRGQGPRGRPDPESAGVPPSPPTIGDITGGRGRSATGTVVPGRSASGESAGVVEVRGGTSGDRAAEELTVARAELSALLGVDPAHLRWPNLVRDVFGQAEMMLSFLPADEWPAVATPRRLAELRKRFASGLVIGSRINALQEVSRRFEIGAWRAEAQQWQSVWDDGLAELLNFHQVVDSDDLAHPLRRLGELAGDSELVALADAADRVIRLTESLDGADRADLDSAARRLDRALGEFTEFRARAAGLTQDDLRSARQLPGVDQRQESAQALISLAGDVAAAGSADVELVAPLRDVTATNLTATHAWAVLDRLAALSTERQAEPGPAQLESLCQSFLYIHEALVDTQANLWLGGEVGRLTTILADSGSLAVSAETFAGLSTAGKHAVARAENTREIMAFGNTADAYNYAGRSLAAPEGESRTLSRPIVVAAVVPAGHDAATRAPGSGTAAVVAEDGLRWQLLTDPSVRFAGQSLLYLEIPAGTRVRWDAGRQYLEVHDTLEWDAVRSFTDDDGRQHTYGTARQVAASPERRARTALPVSVSDGDGEYAAPTDSTGARDAGHLANLCGQLVLARLPWVDPGRIPEAVGARGLGVPRIVEIAGAGPEHVRRLAVDPDRPYAGVAEALSALPEAVREGASALVFVGSDEADEYGVAGHVFRVVYRDGEVHREDPGLEVFGLLDGTAGPWELEGVNGLWMVAFDAAGEPVVLPGAPVDAAELEFVVGLSHDTVGDQVLSVLDEAGEQWRKMLPHTVKVRHVSTMAPGLAGSYSLTELVNRVLTTGASLLTQAVTLVHENEHGRDAEELPMPDPYTMMRGEYVHAILRWEARAFAREATFADVLKSSGYDLEEDDRHLVYHEAHSKAIRDALRADPGLSEPEQLAIGYRAGVRALEVYLAVPDKVAKLFDSPAKLAEFCAAPEKLDELVPDDVAGDHSREARDRLAMMIASPENLRAYLESPEAPDSRSSTAEYLGGPGEYVRNARRNWLAARTANGLETRHTPTTPENAHEIRRSAMARTAAKRDLAVLDRAIGRDIERRSVRPAAPESPADQRRRTHDDLLFRDLVAWRAIVARDAAAAQARADATVARDVLSAMLQHEPGILLTDHVAVIGGNWPRLVVIAGEAGDHRQKRDGAIAAHPEFGEAADLDCEFWSAFSDWDGRVWVERTGDPEARPEPALPEVPWLNLADRAGKQRIRRARQLMRKTTNGRRADRILSDNEVVLLLEAHADDRYYPARNVQVLDAGNSDAELAAALTACAVHVLEARRSPGSSAARELLESDRSRYVKSRLAEEARAQAEGAETLRQLRELGDDTEPPGPIEYVYTAAYRHVLGGVGAGRSPSDPETALARQAGTTALQPLLTRTGPRLSAPTYAEFYGWAWDDANGYERAPSKPAEQTGADTPEVRPHAASVVERRLRELVAETGRAKEFRDRARAALADLSDDELAALTPASGALELLRRSTDPRSRAQVALLGEYHRWDSRIAMLTAATEAYEQASHQRAVCELLALERSLDPAHLVAGSPLLSRLTRERDEAWDELARFLDIERKRLSAEQVHNLLGQAQQQQHAQLSPDDPRRFLFADRTAEMCARVLKVDPIVRAVEALAELWTRAENLDARAYPDAERPVDSASRIGAALSQLPDLDEDARAAVTELLGAALERPGARLWPVEPRGAEQLIQVRDADGSTLLDIRLAPGTTSVHLALRRDRPDRVLFAQTLVPRLLTGWPEQQIDKVFAQVVERFAGMNRPGGARLIGADATVTAELSGARGARALDVTVAGDAGNLALYFDEEATARSGATSSAGAVVSGTKEGAADHTPAADSERAADPGSPTAEHTAPQQENAAAAVGDARGWIGDRATAAWADIDAHTESSGPFNCGPLVQWFVRDAVGGDAAAAMEPAAVDDALIALAGMHKLDLVAGLRTGWAERPIGAGAAGLAAMVAQVHRVGGVLVGAVDPAGAGLGHCFAVAAATTEFAAVLNALPVTLRGEAEVEAGELVVFDNAAGGLLRGQAIYDWVVSGWAGSADVHVAGFDAAGVAHEEFDIEVQWQRGPAGRLGALERGVRTLPWGQRAGSQQELDGAGARLAALLGLGPAGVDREHLQGALESIRREFDRLDDAGWKRVAAGRAPRVLPSLLGRFLADLQMLETISDPALRQFKARPIHEDFADDLADVLGGPSGRVVFGSALDRRPALVRLAQQSGDRALGELAEAVATYQDLADGLSAATPAQLQRRHSTRVEGFGALGDSVGRTAIATVHDLLERFPIQVAGIAVTRRSDEAAPEEQRVSSVAGADVDGYGITSARLEVTVPSRRSPSEDEVCRAAIEGMGKALVIAGRWRAERQAPRALREYFRNTHGDPESADFMVWLRRQFPASCFDGDAFLPNPALARSFADVYRELADLRPAPDIPVTEGVRVLYELLVRLAEEVNFSRDRALRTPETDQERADHRAKLEALRQLEVRLGRSLRYQDLLMVEVDLETVLELVDETLRHYEEVGGTDLVEFRVAPDSSPSHAFVTTAPDGLVLTLNERWAINREYLETSYKISVDDGFHPPSRGSAWRALFAHELAHVGQRYSARALVPEKTAPVDTDVLLRHQAEEWRKVLPQLVALFVESGRPEDLGRLPAWLQEVLSGYSFKANGTPNFGEAFAEARGSALLGLHPEQAERILHAHQVKTARAETERRLRRGEQPAAGDPDNVSPVPGQRSIPSDEQPAAPAAMSAGAAESRSAGAITSSPVLLVLRDQDGRPVSELDEPERAERLSGETDSAAAVSRRGATHDRNEDAVVVVEFTHNGKPVQIAAVFDGVGGAPDGHRAAQKAATELGAYLQERWSSTRFRRKVTRESVLRDALHHVQQRVQELGRLPEYSGHPDKPQCTVAAVITEADRFTVGWVGDSRIGWTSADGRHAMWWTGDHSSVRMFARENGMSEREALDREPWLENYRHAIEYALGREGRIPAAPGADVTPGEYLCTVSVSDDIAAPVIAEDGTITVPRGGVVLAMTDGAIKTMPGAGVLGDAAARHAGEPRAIAAELVQRAVDEGETDDVSVVAVGHRSAEPRRAGTTAAARNPLKRWWRGVGSRQDGTAPVPAVTGDRRMSDPRAAGTARATPDERPGHEPDEHNTRSAPAALPIRETEPGREVVDGNGPGTRADCVARASEDYWATLEVTPPVGVHEPGPGGVLLKDMAGVVGAGWDPGITSLQQARERVARTGKPMIVVVVYAGAEGEAPRWGHAVNVKRAADGSVVVHESGVDETEWSPSAPVAAVLGMRVAEGPQDRVVPELPEHARGFEQVRIGLRAGLAALGPETFARVDAAKKELAALPGYWYIPDLPMPEPGEAFGADWVSKRGEWLSALFDGKFDELRDIELTEKDLLELGRIVERFPVYATLALIVAAGLSVDQLLHIRKMGWGQLFIRQTKITQEGETISLWKFRTMRKGNPLEPSSRKIGDRTTPISRFARATSLDELPQLLSIATGTMQYFSGRPLLQQDHERMKTVLTSEEYEFWNGHLKNDLWSALHFPGCRAHDPESETYLRARYLAAYIWSNIGSRAAQEYMMRIVDRYLAGVVALEAPNLIIETVEDILRGMAGLLPGSSGQQLLDAADRVAGGPVRQITQTMRGTANRISNLVYPTPGEPEAAGSERKKMLAAIDFVEGEIWETDGSLPDPNNGTEPVADSNTGRNSPAGKVTRSARRDDELYFPPAVTGNISVLQPEEVLDSSRLVRQRDHVVAGVVTSATVSTGAGSGISLGLEAVEVAGSFHPNVEQALGGPTLLQLRVGDLALECKLWYRIFDSGRIQVLVFYKDAPDTTDTDFRTLTRAVDTAFRGRFPGSSIEVEEYRDDGTDFRRRHIGPEETAASRAKWHRVPGARNSQHRRASLTVGSAGQPDEVRARGARTAADEVFGLLSECGWGDPDLLGTAEDATYDLVEEALSAGDGEVRVTITVTGPNRPALVEVADNSVAEPAPSSLRGVGDTGFRIVPEGAGRVRWFRAGPGDT